MNWKLVFVVALAAFAVLVALALVEKLYWARLEFRRDIIDRFTEARLSLWASTLSEDWVVTAPSGVELARSERWELAVQEALEKLAQEQPA